jgi:hypothetical protein
MITALLLAIAASPPAEVPVRVCGVAVANSGSLELARDDGVQVLDARGSAAAAGMVPGGFVEGMTYCVDLVGSASARRVVGAYRQFSWVS